MTDARGDRISLTLPGASAYRGIVSLVVAGVGGRLDLPYERTDDLQLALLSVLEAAADEVVTVELDVVEHAVQVGVGPLRDGTGADRALSAVLRPLVDATDATRRDGREWLVLAVTRASG